MKETTAGLYDIQGRLIMNQSLDTRVTENTMDISSLSPGVYIVRVNNGFQNQTQKLIIK